MKKRLQRVCILFTIAFTLLPDTVFAEATTQPAAPPAKAPEPIPQGTFRIKFEMTAAGQIAIRVQDKDGKKLPMDGYIATFVIEKGAERVVPFLLEPAGGNKLETRNAAGLTGEGRRILTLRTPDGRAAQWIWEWKHPSQDAKSHTPRQ